MSAAKLQSGIAATAALVSVLVAFGSATTAAQESASYVMERVTISAAAGVADSATFTMSMTFGQEGPVGSQSACNDGFVHGMGFWSVLGDSPVPIVLTVERDESNASAVKLMWTGTAALFDLQRSFVPEEARDFTSLLLTTPNCASPDAPPIVEIVYYVVQAN